MLFTSRMIVAAAAAALVVALVPGAAGAGPPPSSISQYVEVIPTSTGSNQSTPTVTAPPIGESEQARLRREQPKVAAELERIASSGSRPSRGKKGHTSIAGLDGGSFARILLLVVLVGGGSVVLARPRSAAARHRGRPAS